MPPPATSELTILEVLDLHPEGLTREALQRLSGRGDQPAHQFRRLLKQLEASGHLRGEGTTRARRYFPRQPSPPVPTTFTLWNPSPEGNEAMTLVQRPLTQRKPCSYERAFLDAYRPNQTHYLRVQDRATLHALGRTPEAQQPAGTYARKILEYLLIDLSWNSSRLEGNTYSLLDTERLFREGVEAEGRKATETQMILNHKQAIEYLVEGAAELDLEPRTLKTLHGILSENLLADPTDEGRLRRTPVGIHDSAYIPLALPQLIEELFEQILLVARDIQDPFEQAFFLLVHIPYLQPFADVNKRTSRLAANLPLLRHNLHPLSFTDLPREPYTLATVAVYENRRIEALRDVFLWAYQRSAERYQALRQSMGDPDPFRLRYRAALREAVRQVVRNLEDPKSLPAHVALFAKSAIPEEDQRRFQALALQELRNLHEGTFARYGLKPSEFERWREIQEAFTQES